MDELTTTILGGVRPDEPDRFYYYVVECARDAGGDWSTFLEKLGEATGDAQSIEEMRELAEYQQLDVERLLESLAASEPDQLAGAGAGGGWDGGDERESPEAQSDEAGDQERIDGGWAEFRSQAQGTWNGDEAGWPAWLAWAREVAGYYGVSDQVNQILDVVDASADKRATLEEYGIAVGEAPQEEPRAEYGGESEGGEYQGEEDGGQAYGGESEGTEAETEEQP